MALIYFYIFYIFYVCIYILLIYSRAILSIAWLAGYATRPVVLLILCIQIVLLRIIIIIILIFNNNNNMWQATCRSSFTYKVHMLPHFLHTATNRCFSLLLHACIMLLKYT